ncbi:MAG: DUF2304 domain-containing protein [Oscillospiraceae bacterium]|nr:DUF2304 domain-containing protein [Oscillospiraceae bacterium]
MNAALRIFLAVCIVVYFGVLLYMLKRKRLILKYSLFWLLSGLILTVFLIWPQLVFNASALIGISDPVNAVFLLYAGCMLLLTLSLTSIVSQFNRVNRDTIQTLALLEKRVRELEAELQNKSREPES